MANILKPKFSSAVGNMSIVEMSPPFERLELQFVPGEIAWNRAANEAPIQVFGRNNDLPEFTGGSDTLNFSIDFYSEDNNLDDVKTKITWLQSLTFAPARKVLINWGDFLQDDVWVLTSVNAVYRKFMPENGMKPQIATADLVFKLSSDKNRVFDEIRTN